MAVDYSNAPLLEWQFITRTGPRVLVHLKITQAERQPLAQTPPGSSLSLSQTRPIQSLPSAEPRPPVRRVTGLDHGFPHGRALVYNNPSRSMSEHRKAHIRVAGVAGAFKAPIDPADRRALSA